MSPKYQLVLLQDTVYESENNIKCDVTLIGSK